MAAFMHNDIYKQLAEILGIDAVGVQRVVIDIQVDDVVKVYVDGICHDKLYDTVREYLVKNKGEYVIYERKLDDGDL